MCLKRFSSPRWNPLTPGRWMIDCLTGEHRIFFIFPLKCFESRWSKKKKTFPNLLFSTGNNITVILLAVTSLFTFQVTVHTPNQILFPPDSGLTAASSHRVMTLVIYPAAPQGPSAYWSLIGHTCIKKKPHKSTHQWRQTFWLILARFSMGFLVLFFSLNNVWRSGRTVSHVFFETTKWLFFKACSSTAPENFKKPMKINNKAKCRLF